MIKNRLNFEILKIRQEKKNRTLEQNFEKNGYIFNSILINPRFEMTSYWNYSKFSRKIFKKVIFDENHRI